MSKKFFISIFSFILIFEYDILFADIDTNTNTDTQPETQHQPCYLLFNKVQENEVSQNKVTMSDVNYSVDNSLITEMDRYKDDDDHHSHIVMNQMLKDLISLYQHKILEKISPHPYLKYIHYATNNNPIVPLDYIDDFVEKPEKILQSNVDYHLFRIRFEPEREVMWDEEMSLLKYLEMYFKQQFGENGMKNYISRSLLDAIEDDFSLDPEEDFKAKYEYKYTRKERDLLRTRAELTTTINSIFDIKNKYLEILLQHILTYYILSNDNYNLDPNLKTTMLEHLLYTSANDDIVPIKDFFPDILDNVKFLEENRYSYYLGLIKKPLTSLIVNKEKFLSSIYPNVLLNKPNISKEVDQYVLEQDMMFLVKYIKYSSKRSLMLKVVNTYLTTTSEKEILEIFNTLSNAINNDIFDLKQIFYIGSFPLSLDKVVKALLNNATIDFSNRDIIDIILSLYGTDIKALGIDYDTAAKKFGLKDKDNNKSLYFTKTPTNSDGYLYNFYQILYYLVSNDLKFCKKLGLKNQDIISSFRETLLDKMVP